MPRAVSALLLFIGLVANKLAYDSMIMLDRAYIGSVKQDWTPTPTTVSLHREQSNIKVRHSKIESVAMDHGRMRGSHNAPSSQQPRFRVISKQNEKYNGKVAGDDSVNRLNHAADIESGAKTNDVSASQEQRTNRLAFQNWDLDVEYQVPETPGAFLHVGKTGGSSIASQLRNGCHSWVPKPCSHQPIENESYVSKLGTYYHTPDFHKLATTKHHFYVVGVRDPFDRLISIYSYQNPENIRQRIKHKKEGSKTPLLNAFHNLYECFPDLEQFATLVGKEPTHYKFNDRKFTKENRRTAGRKANKRMKQMPQPTSYCKNLARAVINQDVRLSDHFYWSMHRIHNMIESQLDSSRVFVLRNENLWGDWVSTNEVLGQTNVSVPDIRLRDNRDVQLPVSTKLSLSGRQNLCLALKPEYDAYLDFLRRADNLQEEDRRHSVQIANRNCPWLKLSF